MCNFYLYKYLTGKEHGVLVLIKEKKKSADMKKNSPV